MSTKGVRHYSESIEVRKPRTGLQRGPTTATVIDPVRDATPEERAATARFAEQVAARQGWDSDGGPSLAKLDCLGLDAS